MTPTRLFEIACEDSKDILDLKEVVDTYKRLDSGAIEMKLKDGNKGVFRIDGNSKKKFLCLSGGEIILDENLSNVHIENDMEMVAIGIVAGYIKEHLDKSDGETYFEVYVVWKCKTLQNWKFLISSSLRDGMYYEMTYNGDKDEWYLDAYKKFENRCIKPDYD